MGNTKERILVVESDPVISDLVGRQALQSMGYQVLVVGDANSAIPQVIQFSPDVAIVNLNLPGLSGKDFLAAINAHRINTPVIILAQKGNEPDIIQAFRLGATDYLQWPLRDAEVVSVVERVLKQVRERREREVLAYQLQQTNQELQHRVRELTTIFAVGKAVTSTTDQRMLVDKIVEGALKVTQADIGWFLLRDETLKTFILAAHRNLPGSLVSRLNQPWDDGISSLVAMSGETLSISGDPFKRFAIASLGQAALIVPIKVQKQVVGVLVTLRRAPKPFEASEQNLLEAVSDYASISLVNARLFRALDDRARSLQAAAEKAELNEKIKNDLFRAMVKVIKPPVTNAAGAVDRMLHAKAGIVTTDQAQLLLTTQDQLLDLARMVETTSTLQQLFSAPSAAPTDLNEISRQAIGAVQQIAQHDGVTLVGELSSAPIIVKANSAPILQVTLGLLSNAVKFSPSGKQVVLRVFIDEQWVHVTVRDNGAGIDPRHQSHLFEPGYRIESQPAHSFSGLGIRLSLMKDVITAQGGKLWVESQPGRGSTFHFTLIPVRGSLRA